MTAAPFLVFCAAATALFLRLVTWGVQPLLSFLVVSVGASGVTLATLLVCELADSRHARAARGQLHVVRDEHPALDAGPLRADVVNVTRLPAGELGPGGDAA